MIPRNRTNETPGMGIVVARWDTRITPLATQSQRHWLTRPGALTVGLRTLGRLELRVLRESVAIASPDERNALQLAHGVPVHLREICMSINGIDCVVARSVLDRQSWSGSWKAIRGLGRRPLADLLYDDPRVTRSKFETARLRTPHPLARLALTSCVGLGPTPVQTLATASLALPTPSPKPTRYEANWARRSVFWRDDNALLVAECFLPGFWGLVNHLGQTTG